MAAQIWNNVGEQRRCEVRFPTAQRYIEAGDSVTFEGRTTACSDSKNRVIELEHVQVVMSYSVKCRGDVSVELISPCGTRSELMSTRALDTSKDPVKEWSFMTVHTWGEDPRGVWRVKVKDNKGTVKKCARGEFEEFGARVSEIRIIFWGTGGTWKKIGCREKELIAEEVIEENDELGHGNLNLDPKGPLAINERIDQEIINAEFIGEHDTDVMVEDLKKAKNLGAASINDEEEEPTSETIESLRMNLIRFLERNGDNKAGEYLRDDVPLSRSARKRED